MCHIVRNDPIQGDVRERRLCSPSAGGIDAVHEGLNALLDLLVVQVVHPDKRGQVGIETGKRLSASPLVLHDTQEVDHLVAERAEVGSRRRCDSSLNAAKPLGNELPQAPPGAVAGQHGQVMDVHIRIPVGVGDLLVVNLAQPVVRGDGTGVGQNQAAEGQGHRSVFLHTPVLIGPDVALDSLLHVENRVAGLTHLCMLLSVQDIGFCRLGQALLHQSSLHQVLNMLDRRFHLAVLGRRRVIKEFALHEQPNDLRRRRDTLGCNLTGGHQGFGHSILDFLIVIRDTASVSLDNSHIDVAHIVFPPFN